MIQLKRFVFFTCLQLPFISTAFGAEIPVQARLLAGAAMVDPAQLNNAIASDGLKKFETLPHFGLELTTPVLRYLDLGVRYSKKSAHVNEPDAAITSTRYADLNQDSVQIVARGTLLQTSLLRFDLFGGIGGSHSSVKIKTASQDGELSKRGSGSEQLDQFGSFLASYGASASIGYKWVYLTVEAGMEQNKVTGLNRSGTVSSAIQEIDLSGSYFMVGLLIDGLQGTRTK